MSTYWKNWIKAAAIRAVKTVAQTAVATIGTSAAGNPVYNPLAELVGLYVETV